MKSFIVSNVRSCRNTCEFLWNTSWLSREVFPLVPSPSAMHTAFHQQLLNVTITFQIIVADQSPCMMIPYPRLLIAFSTTHYFCRSAFLQALIKNTHSSFLQHILIAGKLVTHITAVHSFSQAAGQNTAHILMLTAPRMTAWTI